MRACDFELRRRRSGVGTRFATVSRMIRNRPAFARVSGVATAVSMARTLRRHGALQVAALVLLAAVLATCVEQAFASDVAATDEGVQLGVVVAKDPAPDEPGPYIWARGEDRAEVVPVPIEGKGKLVGGKVRLPVRAPLAKVRAALLDVKRWPEFIPNVRKSRVTAASADSREFELEGAAPGLEPLRMRARLARNRGEAGAETYVTELIGGNVQQLRAIWSLEAISEERTDLVLELFVRPAQPVPRAALNRANLEATAEAAVALRRRAEGRPRSSAP